MRASAVPAARAVAPPIRIRYVLVGVALALSGTTLVPRARAAFQLYTAATAFADYALCMVGPTGPSLLRDNPSEFWRLARRRLVTALADEHPFKKCEKTALLVSDSPVSSKAHAAAASAFAEWGGDPTDGEAEFRLSDLGVGTRKLAELSDRAWPFVREGYTSLVIPSSYAPEAPHPLEPPRPALVRGAPQRRSLSRCVAPDGDAEFTLDISADRKWKSVRSATPGGSMNEARFAPSDARVFSVSCDDTKVIIGIGREGSRDIALVACDRGGGCERTPLPRLSPGGRFAKFPLDVVRVGGVNVVAMTMQRIVRVTSTRDEGASWTPFTVAYDPGEAGAGDAEARLTPAGRRVLLSGTGRGDSSWILASDDSGASWHAP